MQACSRRVRLPAHLGYKTCRPSHLASQLLLYFHFAFHLAKPQSSHHGFAWARWRRRARPWWWAGRRGQGARDRWPRRWRRRLPSTLRPRRRTRRPRRRPGPRARDRRLRRRRRPRTRRPRWRRLPAAAATDRERRGRRPEPRRRRGGTSPPRRASPSSAGPCRPGISGSGLVFCAGASAASTRRGGWTWSCLGGRHGEVGRGGRPGSSRACCR